MKKLLAIVVLALFIALNVTALFGSKAYQTVNAEETTETTENEGENLPTTDESPASGEIPTEEPTEPTSPEESLDENEETITITKEELTALINSALTEQQKQVVDGIAGKIAQVLGLDHNAVYLVLAGALVIILVIIVLVAKVYKGKGSLKTLDRQLKAQQSAYAVLSETKEDLTKILKNFDAEQIGALVKEAYTLQAVDIVNEVSEKVVSKLKLDESTIAELLGNEKILVEQVKLLSEALIAIASNNRDVAIKILSKAPTQETVNELSIENKKLKTALGEKAVKDTLGVKDDETKGA